MGRVGLGVEFGLGLWFGLGLVLHARDFFDGAARRKIKKKKILHHKVYCLFDWTLTEISFEQVHLWLLWSILNSDNFFLPCLSFQSIPPKLYGDIKKKDGGYLLALK